MKFHLYGTSYSGIPVDEYAVTDSSGVASFNDILIGTGYTLEEVDTPIRYVIPDDQTAAIEWNTEDPACRCRMDVLPFDEDFLNLL